MSPPSPNIIHLQHYKLIETNHRKHIKLMVMQEKSQARRNEQPQSQEEEAEGHMILSKIDDSNFSELNSEKQEDNESDSYDSQPFNAYQLGQDQASFNNKIRQGQVISIKQVSDSFLVLDFKAPADEPKINVLPPVLPPLPPPRIQKSSIGIQTMPIEPIPIKVVEKQAPPKVVMIPQLKKQPPANSASQLQQKTQLKKENMILTASIEMVYRKQQKSKQKSKPSTFMEYYNSQPVKAPSNILERYIKRKK